MSIDVIRALDEVLNAEKLALLTGEYEGLAELQVSKEQLIARLPDNDITRTRIADLKTKMVGNQALLRGAIDGIGAARQRMAALEQVQRNLSVYGPTGKIEIASETRSVVEKKA